MQGYVPCGPAQTDPRRIGPRVQPSWIEAGLRHGSMVVVVKLDSRLAGRVSGDLAARPGLGLRGRVRPDFILDFQL